MGTKARPSAAEQRSLGLEDFFLQHLEAESAKLIFDFQSLISSFNVQVQIGNSQIDVPSRKKLLHLKEKISEEVGRDAQISATQPIYHHTFCGESWAAEDWIRGFA